MPIASAPIAQRPYSSIRRLEEAGRDVPADRPLAEHRRDRRRRCRRASDDRADPVATPSRSSATGVTARCATTSASSTSASTARRIASCVRTPHGDHAGGEREHDRDAARPDPGPRDQVERERRDRVGERLLDEERRVGERRRAAGAGGREERPRPRDDEPCEPVGGEDRRRHREHAERLDRAVRRRDVVEPPGRRREVGVKRRRPAPARRRGALRRPVSAIERESCVNSISSVKSVGVIVLRGLPGVEREPGRRRAPSSGERRRRPRSRLREDVIRRGSRPAASGVISVWRRTRRHGIPAAAQAATTAAQAVGATSGIVTSTSSGPCDAIRRVASRPGRRAP